MRSAVVAGLVPAVVILALVALSSGRYPVPVSGVVDALLGVADARTTMVVLDWRLPRVVAALLCGAALGVAGALFQSLTRNPLGSPDILGLDAGAQAGLLLAVGYAGTAFDVMGAGALAGALSTALAIALLGRRGGTSPRLRLIVIGIGLAAMLNAFNLWLMLSTDLQTAMRVAGWRAGSLVDIDSAAIMRAGPVILVCLLLSACHVRVLRQLELGDGIALAHGVAVGRTKLAGAALGVVLTSTTTAIAGPIAFLALISPQLARLMTRSARFSPISSGLTGAVVLLAADLAAARLFPQTQMPVGALTSCLGGACLVWLLLREVRRRSL